MKIPVFWPRLALLAMAVVFGFVGTLRAWPAALVIRHGLPTSGYYLWSYQHFAYSDIVALYQSRDLYRHLWPYIQGRLEYPPIIGIFLWLAAWAPGVYGYLVINAVVLTGALWASSLVAAAVRGVRAVGAWVYSPLLAIYAIYNWDLLGILAYGLAVLQWHRKRFAWTGFWIGMGISTKLFPVVLLPFMLADLWKHGERRAAGMLALSMVGVLAAINLPFSVLNMRGWSLFWRYNASRGPDPGFWQWVFLHNWLTIADINGASLALVGVAGFWLLFRVWQGRLSPILAGALALSFWFLVNKVYSPQYILWVLYALVIADQIGWEAWLLNLAGWMDFGLAMVWLALGTSGSPQEPLMGIYVAPGVILVRDVALAAVLWSRRQARRVRRTLGA